MIYLVYSLERVRSDLGNPVANVFQGSRRVDTRASQAEQGWEQVAETRARNTKLEFEK